MKKYLFLLLITAAISCKKSSTTSTVTDKIRISLTTSTAAYDAAAANTWVQVTAGEYGDLLSKVAGAARAGATEAYMNTMPSNGWAADYTVAADTDHVQIPASSFVIAWSVRTGIDSSSAAASKLKISTARYSGYSDYGGELPDIGKIAPKTRVFFVLKTPSGQTSAAPSFTGVYSPTAYFLGAGSGGPVYYHSGNYASPASKFSSGMYSQVIATNNKQW
jgi:hypothetical protein